MYGTPAIWDLGLRVPATPSPCPVLRRDHIAELSPHSHQNGVFIWHGQGVEIQILRIGFLFTNTSDLSDEQIRDDNADDDDDDDEKGTSGTCGYPTESTDEQHHLP